MYAPIYHPPAPPLPESVRAAEADILAAEGAHHVAGRYFADEANAARERRWEAERRVRVAGRARVADAMLARVRVSAWMPAADRSRVDAIVRGQLDGAAVVTHRDTLAALRADLACDATDVVLVALARIEPADLWPLAVLRRDFPAVPALAVVLADPSAADRSTCCPLLGAALTAGRAGVDVIADLRTADGFARLRDALDPRRTPDSFMRRAVAAVLRDLATNAANDDAITSESPATDVPRTLTRFVVTLFERDLVSARLLAYRLAVRPSTLSSRFLRAGLPSPRCWVTAARLVWAARLAETSARSSADLADALGVSSAQSFRRTMRRVLGMSPNEFRARCDGAAMLDRFRATLVLPHRETLRRFDPVGAAGTIAPRIASTRAGRAVA